MNILDTIIAAKKKEVAQHKSRFSLTELEKKPAFKKEPLSLSGFLLREDKTGIIAEFKRKSPSKGIINDTAAVCEVTGAYVAGGASALSVLTDQEFFGGTLEDLQQATAYDIPLLRKEFIIDEYQLIESKAWGADAILLIAACLSAKEVKSLSCVAKSAGLNVLLEIHSESEMDHICDEVDVIGINNRDLKTFKVDIMHSVALCRKLPANRIKISESGIDDINTIKFLKQEGFHGFLMGERFMKEPDPGAAFAQFVKGLE